MPGTKDIPSTIARSGAKARHTWAKAHDNAIGEYGRGETASRVAYGALKHTHEKVGDHWEPKDHKGPSDDRSADPNARNINGGTATGGVDVKGHTRDELYDKAKQLDVKGRSHMSKQALAEAIKKANDRETRRARS